MKQIYHRRFGPFGDHEEREREKLKLWEKMESNYWLSISDCDKLSLILY